MKYSCISALQLSLRNQYTVEGIGMVRGKTARGKRMRCRYRERPEVVGI